MWFDRPRSPQNITPPPAGNILNFVNEDGAPAVMDDQGAVTPSATLLGGPVPLQEQVGDPPTAADVIAVYNKQGVGLVQRAPSSGPITALGGSSGLTMHWKGGTPGNPYVTGDTPTVLAGEALFIQIADPDTLFIQFPTAVGNPGAELRILNLQDKKSGSPGLVAYVPAAGESIDAAAVDAPVASIDPSFLGVAGFMSDGNGTWYHVAFGGNLLSAELP